MKLAEALLERADLQKRINELRVRLSANSKVQEGETPAEDPRKLFAELDADTERLAELIQRINLTNSAVKVNGETLTALLARRECLGLKVSVLQDFLNEASRTVMRGSKSEVIVRSTVSVTDTRKRCDETAAELRKLDTLIQSRNWTAELK